MSKSLTANRNRAVNLVLASRSQARKRQLMSLGYAFRCVDPDIVERTLPVETSVLRAVRLAREKAVAGASQAPSAVVIGADQVAACNGRVLSKPGTVERAIAQLDSLSGKNAVFHSAVCVLAPGRDPIEFADTTMVTFRRLSKIEIERYVERDAPLECAGAFKSEKLGTHLFERIETQDPTALIGLPMIELARALRSLGINPLTAGPTTLAL